VIGSTLKHFSYQHILPVIGSTLKLFLFPKIVVIDQNDEIPQFAGADPLTTYIEASVLENQSPPAVVATVAATDADIDPHILPSDWFNPKTLFLLTYLT
jgi:hypothetical protein